MIDTGVYNVGISQLPAFCTSLRGLAKISLHAMLSVLVLQADALAKVQADRLGDLRACTRKVA